MSKYSLQYRESLDVLRNTICNQLLTLQMTDLLEHTEKYIDFKKHWRTCYYEYDDSFYIDDFFCSFFYHEFYDYIDSFKFNVQESYSKSHQQMQYVLNELRWIVCDRCNDHATKKLTSNKNLQDFNNFYKND